MAALDVSTDPVSFSFGAQSVLTVFGEKLIEEWLRGRFSGAVLL
jgi:hypothetical protein